MKYARTFSTVNTCSAGQGTLPDATPSSCPSWGDALRTGAAWNRPVRPTVGTHCQRGTVLKEVDRECHTWVVEGGNTAKGCDPETHALRSHFWGPPFQRATCAEFPKPQIYSLTAQGSRLSSWVLWKRLWEQRRDRSPRQNTRAWYMHRRTPQACPRGEAVQDA